MRRRMMSAGIVACVLAGGPAWPQDAPAPVDYPKTPDDIVRGLSFVRDRVAKDKPAPATVRGEPAPSVSLAVHFPSGSATLTLEAVRTLDVLGRALADARLAGDRFRVEGHTDTVGSSALNQALSEQRARAVVDYLSGHAGIAPQRLEPVGLGKEGLAVPTGDQVAEPRNRRVRVVNLGT